MTLDNPNILNDVLLSHTTMTYHQLTPLTPVLKNMLASFEGFNNSGNGALTQTTATLTPTVLRNIEQTFLDYADDTNTSLPFQAGFVPPIAPTYPVSSTIISGSNSVLTDPEYSMDSSSMSSSSWHTSPPPQEIIESAKHNGVINNNNNHSLNNKNTIGKAPRRNMGGRRPNRPSNLSPEEEEKRRVRRERNKAAAARCRRRREDHTNELMTEVEGLENKKKGLQLDLLNLQQEKKELESLLQNHSCKRQVREIQMTYVLPMVEKIKCEPADETFDNDCRPPSPKRPLLSSAVFNSNPVQTLPQIQTVAQVRPNRPNTLNVPMQPSSQALNTVQIDTPSNGTVNFNFDSLMEGGTGLTPINHPLRVITDPRNGVDLITPTSDASRLCSL